MSMLEVLPYSLYQILWTHWNIWHLGKIVLGFTTSVLMTPGSSIIVPHILSFSYI